MPTKVLRSSLTILILFGTIAAFIYYFVKHPAVRTQLAHTSPLVLGSLLLLYFGIVIATGLILMATLVLCNVKLSARESLLLTMYSAIVNFFGPLQSGPAFRAIYLKKKHGLKLKDYTLATFVYYALYALFSGLFLLSGLLGWWLLLVGIALAIGAYVIHRSQLPLALRIKQLNLRGLGFLAGATLLQVVIVAIIYYIELRTVSPGVHLDQAIIYTGAANFALFVSLTPGAIGFRESFLLFSRRLHHISSTAIVSANIIDRSMYIILLLILALFIFGTHAQQKLRAQTKND
jgi:uncharacterized membrane protein YbhN (UPF0104 family)